MTVLFEDDLTTVIHGRWQDHLDMLDLADVLITDPPYGQDYVSNAPEDGPTANISGDKDTRERDELLHHWFVESPDATRPALVFGKRRLPAPTAAPIREFLIWYKGARPGMGDLSLPWGPSTEEVYVMGGTDPASWVGPRGSAVLRAGRAESVRAKYGHPTPKPVQLMQELIVHTTGATIIDPYAGVGSTAVAARMLNRRCVAIEMVEEWANAAAARVSRIPLLRPVK